MRRFLFGSVLFAFATALMIAGPGCKSSSGTKEDESLTTSGEQVPAYFHEIPADTFYVYTGLEPVPKSITKQTLEEFEEPFSSVISTILEMADRSPQADQSVLVPLLREMQGNFNPEGWRELGFSLEPQFAVYGVGGIPVMRMNLGDPEAFESLLNRLESKSDLEVQTKEAHGVSYRLYTSQGMHVPLVVRDGAVVVSLYEEELGEAILPYVLGHKEPEESLAETGALRELADTYDYEDYMLGYVDLRGLIRTLTGVDSPDATTKAVLSAGDLVRERPSETCRREIAGLADAAPRLVFGSTEFTAETVRTEFGLELESSYAQELAATVGPVPGLNTSLFERSILALGMGVDLGKLTKMMRDHARNVAEDPYECEELESLNRTAKRQANRPVPTVVTQMRGLGLMLESLSFDGGMRPTEVNAVAVVRMQNPKSLIGRLQPFVPGMARADIGNDGVPVPLQRLGRAVSVLKAPHVAQKGEALGFSSGVGMQDELAALLEKPTPESTRTALAMSYDLDKFYASLPKRVKQRMKQFVDGSTLASTFSGALEARILFREGGIFVRTRQDRSSGTSGEDDVAGESVRAPSRPAASGAAVSVDEDAPN